MNKIEVFSLFVGPYSTVYDYVFIVELKGTVNINK